MLKELKLTNFSQHESLVVNFTEGMNVIKGANEKGKSTLFSAIAYALGGSRALPLSLDETVTWGKSASSLRVELLFSHAGVNYKISRSKSGAQLTYNDVLVSGQAEVTSSVERIFGVNMPTAKYIMLAEQGSLRGSLDDGAVQLIERLSNMALIDKLVQKVQDNLPSGNTKVLEQGLEELLSFWDKPPKDHTDAIHALESELLATENALKRNLTEEAELSDLLNTESSAYNKQVEDYNKALGEFDSYQKALKQIAQFKSTLQTVNSTVVTDPDPRSIAELRLAKEAQDSLQETRRVHNLFCNQPKESGYKLDRGAVKHALATYEVECKLHLNKIQELSGLVAGSTAKLVTGDCNFCGKDLSSVDQVVESNKSITDLVTKAEADIKLIKSKLDDLQEKHKLYRLTDIADSANISFANNFPKYVKLCGTFPETLEWIGGEVADTKRENFSAIILEKEKASAAIAKLEATAVFLGNELAKAEVALCNLPTSDVAAAKALMDSSTVRHALYKEAMALLVVAGRELQLDATNLKQKIYELATKAEYERKAYEQGSEDISQRRILLREYALNNNLIKRLREIRPVVAKKLWAAVLNPISSLLSMQRGETSVVTRDTDKFFINGKPAEAYSGSAKDCLGLAIRIALQKTFTPAVDFMLVDEPAAAASDEREASMLGLLASAGYGQVIVVTHSSLADTFATNFIQL